MCGDEAPVVCAARRAGDGSHCTERETSGRGTHCQKPPGAGCRDADQGKRMVFFSLIGGKRMLVPFCFLFGSRPLSATLVIVVNKMCLPFTRVLLIVAGAFDRCSSRFRVMLTSELTPPPSLGRTQQDKIASFI